MAGDYRIAGAGRLTPAQTARFSFDGTAHTGLEGDTLASALLANGVHLVGRSFKYHRPRGILSAGAEEPNALVTVERDAARQTPNVRATVQELHDGLTVRSQNRWPGLSFDVGAVNDLASPMFSAGFYYKTFMWPKAAWKHVYEPNIRAAAGLGKAPAQADPNHYSSRFAHCEVLVVGGALRFETGSRIDGKDGWAWAQDSIAKLAAMDNVRLLSRATAFGYYAQNFVGITERVTDHLSSPDAEMPRERLWQVRARRVILATGAIERHMVFADNDRPGVMLASAARTYLNHYGVAVGRNVGVYTANDSGYLTAIDLKKAGIGIAAIVDLRDNPSGAVFDEARSLSIEVLPGRGVTSTGGRLRVSSMTVAPKVGSGSRTIAVDALLMSAGWTPSVHLFSQSRGKVAFDADTHRFLPGAYAQDCVSVGACNGTDTLEATIAEAFKAGEKAAKDSGAGLAKSPPPLTPPLKGALFTFY